MEVGQPLQRLPAHERDLLLRQRPRDVVNILDKYLMSKCTNISIQIVVHVAPGGCRRRSTPCRSRACPAAGRTRSTPRYSRAGSPGRNKLYLGFLKNPRTFIMRISCWIMVKSSPGSSLITLIAAASPPDSRLAWGNMIHKSYSQI